MKGKLQAPKRNFGPLKRYGNPLKKPPVTLDSVDPVLVHKPVVRDADEREGGQHNGEAPGPDHDVGSVLHTRCQ